MRIQRILIVVFCAAILAALTPAVSGAQTVPDGVLPVGEAASIVLDDGAKVDFAAQSAQATDLDVHVERRSLSDSASDEVEVTDTSGTTLAPVGTEVLVVDALDTNGRAVTDFPHDVEVAAATDGLPAQVSEFTAGVAITLPVDAALAADVAAHTIAVYSRANADETWEKLPSAYDRATGMVTANSDHLSEFAVLAVAENDTENNNDDAAGGDGDAGVAAQVVDGPTVVLDPDDDLGFANWPEGRESELARNLQLTAAVETGLVNACAAEVIITRGDEPFVDKAVRGAVAQNANPDLTVTLAFNADTGEPFGDADNGGVLTWASDAADKAFAQRFLEAVPEFTGRPSPVTCRIPKGSSPTPSWTPPPARTPTSRCCSLTTTSTIRSSVTSSTWWSTPPSPPWSASLSHRASTAVVTTAYRSDHRPKSFGCSETLDGRTISCTERTRFRSRQATTSWTNRSLF